MKPAQSQLRAPGAAPSMDRNMVGLTAGMAGAAPPVSLDFLAALGNALAPSADPHPVGARNVGLVPAWQRWTAYMEGKPGERSSADQLIADPGYRFDQSAKLIKEAISVDPVWRRIVSNGAPGQEPDMGHDLVTASVTRCGNPLCCPTRMASRSPASMASTYSTPCSPGSVTSP